jgi:hypothetical protein
MGEVAPQDIGYSDSIIRSFAQKLALFSSTVSTREKQILASIIMERLDPLDRMKFRDIHQLLTQDELFILNGLMEEENSTDR